MEYYFVIADGEPNLKDIVKEGSFDNGYGYILSWYIVSSEPESDMQILARTSFKIIPRFIGYLEEVYTFITSETFTKDMEEYIIIDTSTSFTNNPYNHNSEKRIIYQKHLSEPWFSFIRDGVKTVEGRCIKGDFTEMQVGDGIQFYNEDSKVLTRITDIRDYPSFYEYIKEETLSKILPGVNSCEDAEKIYAQYYNLELPARAFELKIEF